MHLQENTIFDLGVKVTRNAVQYPLHHVTYVAAKFEVVNLQQERRRYIYKKIQYLTFDLGVKLTQNTVSTLYIM